MLPGLFPAPLVFRMRSCGGLACKRRSDTFNAQASPQRSAKSPVNSIRTAIWVVWCSSTYLTHRCQSRADRAGACPTFDFCFLASLLLAIFPASRSVASLPQSLEIQSARLNQRKHSEVPRTVPRFPGSLLFILPNWITGGKGLTLKHGKVGTLFFLLLKRVKAIIVTPRLDLRS